MIEDWIGVVTAGLMGIGFVLAGLPLWFDRVAPNRVYGFRTKATRSNETLWYAVNKPAGGILALTGLVLLAITPVGIAAGKDANQQEALVWVALAIAGIGLAIALIRGSQIIQSFDDQGSHQPGN